MTWTAERRKQQAEAIKRWRPWDKSTGPVTAEGKAKVSRNAFKGGHREIMRQLGNLLAEQRRVVRDVTAATD